MINIVICGSRHFTDYSVLSSALDDFLYLEKIRQVASVVGHEAGHVCFFRNAVNASAVFIV